MKLRCERRPLPMQMLIVLICATIISSCGQSMGDRVDIDNLKVYYLPSVPKTDAIAFAKFWKENGFLGQDEQFIQLSITEKGMVHVKLIEKEKYHDQYLSVEEQALLSQLERMLEKEVFQKRVVILITDNTYAEIERQ
jgi:hypothetical protein